VIGAPSSGKKTQVANLVTEFGFHPISLKEACQAESVTGSADGKELLKLA